MFKKKNHNSSDLSLQSVIFEEAPAPNPNGIQPWQDQHVLRQKNTVRFVSPLTL